MHRQIGTPAPLDGCPWRFDLCTRHRAADNGYDVEGWGSKSAPRASASGRQGAGGVKSLSVQQSISSDS